MRCCRMDDVAKLRWRCRRGMRELDQLTGGYLEGVYISAGAQEQAAFRALLELPDPELWSLLMGQSDPATEEQKNVIERMRKLT